MANRFKTPRGTKDILPAEMSKWHFLESHLRKVFSKYNFSEIRTPAFEDTELFARGIGQTTDIVQKEMYTLTDKGGRSYTLKPEMTASVMRSYLEHNLGDHRRIQKLYYISPMFRQEKPQAGRFREFYQYGIEIIGTDNYLADVETIALSIEVLHQLGIKEISIKVNSVGCNTCRPKYKEVLKSNLKNIISELCSDCQNRYHTNPLRILDCKKENCNRLTKDIPAIFEYLCHECKEHFDNVRKHLDYINLQYMIDKRLVRGLDYYTKTAFEIQSNQLGSQDSIVGGGLYDYLAEEIGGQSVPAVGFAAGMDRLLMVLEKLQLFPEFDNRVDFYFIGLGEEALKWVFKKANELRRNGLVCEYDYLNRSLKAQMREANKFNSQFVLIVGDNEIASKTVILKEMNTGDQETVPFNSLDQVILGKKTIKSNLCLHQDDSSNDFQSSVKNI